MDAPASGPVVINTDVLRNEDDIKLGDTITFNMNGDEMDWVVVGIVRGVLTGATAFVDFDYHARVTNEVDRAFTFALTRYWGGDKTIDID